MEKNGAIVLTPEEAQEVRNGRVPQRIQRDWGLTLEELTAIINHQTTEE